MNPAPHPDDAAFAAGLQRLAGEGGFDPLALLGARPAVHSAALVPLSPALAAARERFLADGTGPLAGLPEQLRAQGAPDPAAAARDLLAAAQGVCLVVLAGDHGVASVPQLVSGPLDEAWCSRAAAALTGVPGAEALPAALDVLRRGVAGGGRWPALVAGPGAAEPRAYWQDLGAAVVATADGALPVASRERLADLAWWTAAAVDALGGPEDDDDRAAQVRLRLIAGDVPAAGRDLAALLRSGGEDHLPDLLQAFVAGAVAAGVEADAGAWLALHLADIDAAIGVQYETAAALFRLRAAAGSGSEVLQAAASLLAARDRKAMRQDLTREPIWRVSPACAGELVDTAEAASLIARSPAFVAKRLDQGTIPSTLIDGRLRLPRQALLAWKAVLDAHGLLA